MAGIPDEDLTGLSDAERAALDGADTAELNAMRGAGATGVDGGDDDDDADDGVAAEAPVAAVATPLAAEAPADDADPSDKEFVSTFNAPPVEDFDVKIATLNTQETELREKLQAGDIDISTYDAEKTRIMEERSELRGDQRLAEFAAQQNESNQKARWQWEQERFFEKETSAKYKDPILFAALDASVKAFAHDPANSKRSSGWFLEQADKQVSKLFAAPAGAADTPPAGKPDLKVVPKTGPVTLATLPSAEIPDTGAPDEFARLNKLNGMALERALSRLTPEETTRYLQSA